MSRDLDELVSSEEDIKNLKGDDLAYFDQRPWLKEEYERVTGEKWPHEDRVSSGTDDNEGDFDPEGLPDDYSEWEYADLQKEVSRRNSDREEDEKIEPESRKGEDLIAALEADDEAAEE